MILSNSSIETASPSLTIVLPSRVPIDHGFVGSSAPKIHPGGIALIRLVNIPKKVRKFCVCRMKKADRPNYPRNACVSSQSRW
jgi:hypothetical protein